MQTRSDQPLPGRGLPPRGLYAITPPSAGSSDRLAHMVEAAVAGGARIVQYRDKTGEHARRLREAETLREICHSAGALLMINDDVALARESGADGVHLGLQDADLAIARATLGPGAVIGATCHDSLERAHAAAAASADYVAFGSFFASPTKPEATPAPMSLLARARGALDLPIAAIGGIDAHRGAQLIAAGAHYLAVVSGVFGATDVRTAARRYARLFDDTP